MGLKTAQNSIDPEFKQKEVTVLINWILLATEVIRS